MKKIGFGEKLAYGLGDFSNNSAYLFVGTFLLSFLTLGLGLGGTVAGAIIMFVTFFDAINDVIIGAMVDKAHGKGTTYGKIMRFSVIPVGVLMALLFCNVKIPTGGKIAYAVIIYALYTIAQTSYQVPFGSLSAAMSGDTDERVALGAYRDWGANVGSFLVNTFGSVIILKFSAGNGDEMTASGFFVAAVIFAILLIIGGIIPAFVCKERVPVVPEQGTSFAAGLKAFGKNRYAVIATIVVCMVNCALVARASFCMYYAPFYLGNPEYIAIILSVMSIVPLAGILLVPAATKKFDRKVMFSAAGVCLIITGLLELIGGNLICSIIGSVFCGLSLCCSITVCWGAIPDIADYGDYATGSYAPGVIYSTLTFVMKAATALASMGLGVILDAYGFEAGNVTETAISGIHTWFGLFPIILGAVALIAGLMFNLTHKRIEEIHEELDKRHAAE